MIKNALLAASLLVSLTFFGQVPNYVSTNGLVGYWPFTGNANDQSVNNNNGTVIGATLTADRFSTPNAAYNFNGTSNYITVPSNATMSGFNDMTISVWVYMNQFAGIQNFVSKWFYSLNCGSNTDNYAGALVNNSLVLATNNNNMTGYTSPQTFTPGDLNVWKHFVFVSKATVGQYIYVNGVLTGSTSLLGGICNSTNALFFGAANSTFRFFKGNLDDIGIWNRQLTNCEIQQLYTASAISLTTTSTSNALCAGNSASLTVSGANNYTWSNASNSNVIVVNPIVTTNYTVSGTNTVTGCTATSIVTQNVAAPIILTANATPSILCVGNSGSLTVSGANTYVWSNSATGPVIVVSPTVTTTYTVTGTNTITGCSATKTITQNVSLCTGVNSLDLNTLISVYPNPTSGSLNISFNGSATNELLINLEDLTGKQLLQETITGNQLTHTLHMNGFENGIYILKISDSAGNKIKTQKIIVSR